MSQHNLDNGELANEDNLENQGPQDDDVQFLKEDQLEEIENEVDQDELNDWVQNEQGDKFNVNPNQFLPQQNNVESRYPQAAQIKKMLDENLIQMKARVQLLQITEHRNLQKARILDTNSQKLQLNKLDRLEKLGIKKKFLEEELIRQDKKKRDIRMLRDKQKQLIQDKQGLLGKNQQINKQEIRNYKDSVKLNHYNTLESVYLENCHLHNKVQEEQRSHQSKQLKQWEDKYFKGQHNYKAKVQEEINSAAEKQEQLLDLERRESNLLQQLKVTQQIFQNSSNKYKEVKETPYQQIVKI